MLYRGGGLGHSPSGVRGGAPRRKFSVLGGGKWPISPDFTFPNTRPNIFHSCQLIRVLPEKKPKSQDRPSASPRPDLVLLLLLSALPGPPGSCYGCTHASRHASRVIQPHDASKCARTSLHDVVAVRVARLHGVCCAVAQPCAAQRRLTLTGVNDFRHVHTCFPSSF